MILRIPLRLVDIFPLWHFRRKNILLLCDDVATYFLICCKCLVLHHVIIDNLKLKQKDSLPDLHHN